MREGKIELVGECLDDVKKERVDMVEMCEGEIWIE